MTPESVTWTTTHGDRVKVWPCTLRTPLADRDRGRWVWRWHVQAGNNRIIEQGQGHPNRRDAVLAALRHHPRVDQ